MKKTLLSLVALSTIALTANAQLLRTTVAQGEIEGVEHNGSALYKNIPYAEPPVGQLRWKAPVAKAPWTGVYKADKWGDRPPQQVDPNQNGGDLGMSEDCLYLSVQTPAKSADEKLPVFVMIHGGGFSTGSYSGTQDSFVKEGIVYCSIEYRLGPLGFMVHPELTKESPLGISGNYGLMDQILALQWIHDNIAAFGGDPEQVTIAGESAGGISVSMLCASPLCKGLFRGAISESGSSFWPVAETRGGNTGMTTVASTENSGLEFQKKFAKNNIKEMRDVPAMDIINQGGGMGMFWPVVDGYVITDDQYKLYQAGNYNDVNVLIGFNSDEGALFMRPMPAEAYKAYVQNSYGDWAEEALKVYPGNNDQEAYFSMCDIMRDGSFGWGTYAWANLQSQTGKGKVYLYYFDQASENTIMPSPRGGAVHVAEMPFFYGYQFNGPFNEIDAHMHQIIESYIINFTKYGDPNAEALPYWTTYTQGQPTVMIMRNGLYLDVVPNQPQMDFFEAFFASRRK